jgi:hypothetical protein
LRPRAVLKAPPAPPQLEGELKSLVDECDSMLQVPRLIIK